MLFRSRPHTTTKNSSVTLGNLPSNEARLLRRLRGRPTRIDAAYVTTPALIRAIYLVHDQVKYLWISDCFVTGLLRVRYNERVAVAVADRAGADHKIGIHDIQDLYN